MKYILYILFCVGRNGEPSLDNFSVSDSPYPSMKDGQVIIKTLYLSVDPALVSHVLLFALTSSSPSIFLTVYLFFRDVR